MLKKLKAIFIEEDPVTHQKDSVPKASKAPKSSSNSKATSDEISAIKEDLPKNVKADSKFINLLLKAIEANNVEGFDYLEFKQSLQSLTQIEKDETRRFKTAFVMAQTMGLNKKKLSDSAQRYINVLAQEEKKFSQAVDNQRNAKVTEKEKTIEGLTKSIESKAEMIEKLQSEVAQEKKKLDNIEEEVKKSLAKVESTKDKFYVSYHLVLDQIKEDLDKIGTYIE